MTNAHPNHQLRSLNDRTTRAQQGNRASRILARRTVAEKLFAHTQGQNRVIASMFSGFMGRGFWGRLKFLFFGK